MNAAFHQLGYTYTGRLANNCYIFDKLEDMNIWVKDLSSYSKAVKLPPQNLAVKSKTVRWSWVFEKAVLIRVSSYLMKI